ncbi:MAG: type III pantothenate kinase [Planctomycetes bacterium]|nr:type III pantothenate kinase [Planctomycetota bacterium]
MSSKSLLIIDAGHSRIKFHHYNQEGVSRETQNLKPFAWPQQKRFLHADECLLVGTNKRMNIRLSAHIKNLEHIPTPITLGVDIRVPLATSCSGVGSDRLAHGLGALQQFPNINCLVVSAGSALVIDLLNHDGNFAGGLIGIGLGHYKEAMSRMNPELLCASTAENYPGTNTEQAVLQGWLSPALKAISGLYAEHLCQKLIITGGDAQSLLPHFPEAIECPHLGADAMAKALGYSAFSQ